MTEPTIALQVKTIFLASQSELERNHFVFAYTITLTNQGDNRVQLLTRKWTITNADGEVIEVEGDGVVGQQPIIEPGDSFSYTSGTALSTPVGVMEGHYGMINDVGAPFKVSIPQFRLALPNILH
ncbi:MAG TPA: Co2+/Mg2+ efflux protein ApaG [Aliidiomarina sp.]|nr:Co2+/Mg2+ efflux protein ApaG [Aliidiomarina sp.]